MNYTSYQTPDHYFSFGSKKEITKKFKKKVISLFEKEFESKVPPITEAIESDDSAAPSPEIIAPESTQPPTEPAAPYQQKATG